LQTGIILKIGCKNVSRKSKIKIIEKKIKKGLFKLSRSCQKDVKKLSKKCLKVLKVLKKLAKSCQKVVKLQKIGQCLKNCWTKATNNLTKLSKKIGLKINTNMKNG
jgi:hypothetical protein